MQNGANSVHKLLRTELEDYIKSQYFGKSPLLLSALSNHIDDEGLLYQKPFIESSPAYVTVPNGINTASIVRTPLSKITSTGEIEQRFRLN